MILDLIKISFNSLLKNKLRTILTILGIYIGIVSIILIITISNSAKKQIVSELNELDSLIVTARVFNMKDSDYFLPKKAISDLLEESSIKRIAIRTEIEWDEFSEISENSYLDDEEYEIHTIEAINREYFNIYPEIKNKLLYGHTFTTIEEDNNLPVCILREDVASKLLGNSKSVGEKITINNQELKVVGIMQNSMENEYDLHYVAEAYILYSYLENSNEEYSISETCYLIEPISINSREEVNTIVDKIFNEYLEKEEYYLDQYLFSTEDVTLKIIDIISLVFIIIAGISVVSGGIGIMNVLLVSVSEKIKEIGIRRALGASKKMIFVQFILEGISIMLIAGILGILTNLLLINVANGLFSDLGLILSIDINIIINTLLFCSILGMVFGIYPAIKASRLNPVDALRN